MSATEFKAFQIRITTLASTLRTLLDETGKELTLSSEQTGSLDQDKRRLDAFNDGASVGVEDFIKIAKKINEEIEALREELQALTKNNEALETPENQSKAFYIIQKIQIRATQLATLAGYAAPMLVGEKQKDQATIHAMEEALFKGKQNPQLLDSQLTIFFSRTAPAALAQLQAAQKNTLTSEEPVVRIKVERVEDKQPTPVTPLPVSTTEIPTQKPQDSTQSNALVKAEKAAPNRETAAKPISPVLPASPVPELKKKAEPLPKWLVDITALALGKKENNLRNEYQSHSAYKNTGSFDDKVANFIQEKLAPSKTRVEQLKLIEDTLKLLEKSGYDSEQKIKIARGLMLFLKYQIEREDNKFKSRLGNMLNKYINETDNSDEKFHEFTAEQCIKEFQVFAGKKLTTTTKKMQEKIKQAAEDKSDWKNITTLFYQSHQKIDAITAAIAKTNLVGKTNQQPKQAPQLMYEGKPLSFSFQEIHTALNRGIEREDISLTVDALPVAAKREQVYAGYRETPYIYPSVKTLLDLSAKKIGQLETQLEYLIRTKGDVPGHLQIIKAAMTDYSYLMKMAEEQYKIAEKRLDQTNQKKNRGPFTEVSTSLAEFNDSLTSLNRAVANIKAQKQEQLSPPLLAFERSKARPIKEIAKEKISELRIKMMAIEASIAQYADKLSPFETEYKKAISFEPAAATYHAGEVSLRAVTGRLDDARDKLEAMRKSSIDNIPAGKLVKQIEQLTDSSLDTSIQKNMDYLQRLVENSGTPPKEDEKELIYTYLRRVEQKLETLVYLAEIAELKLDPSVNRIRRVSDKEAKTLQTAVEKISTYIENFPDRRHDALIKLGIEKPARTSEP